jgi:hypothetical protein
MCWSGCWTAVPRGSKVFSLGFGEGLLQKGMRFWTALFAFRSRLGCSGWPRVDSDELGATKLVSAPSWRACSGWLKRWVEALGVLTFWFRATDEGIRRMPMLAWRTPTGGRRCMEPCCGEPWGRAAWYILRLGAELLRRRWGVTGLATLWEVLARCAFPSPSQTRLTSEAAQPCSPHQPTTAAK